MANSSKSKYSEKGFTLVELLVVIITIGILAAVAIPAFLNQRQRANDATLQSDLRNAAIVVNDMTVEYPNAVSNSLAFTPELWTEITSNIKTSPGVHMGLHGNQNNFCLTGYHENGKRYYDRSTVLQYHNNKGGFSICATPPDVPGYAFSWAGGVEGQTAWFK